MGDVHGSTKSEAGIFFAPGIVFSCIAPLMPCLLAAFFGLSNGGGDPGAGAAGQAGAFLIIAWLVIVFPCLVIANLVASLFRVRSLSLAWLRAAVVTLFVGVGGWFLLIQWFLIKYGTRI